MTPARFEWGDRVTVTGSGFDALYPLEVDGLLLVKIGGTAESGGSLLAVQDWDASVNNDTSADTIRFTAGHVYQRAAGSTHAFLWTPETGMRDLGTLVSRAP